MFEQIWVDYLSSNLTLYLITFYSVHQLKVYFIKFAKCCTLPALALHLSDERVAAKLL